MTADAAWDALSSALEHVTPPCEGLDAFTADRLTDDERYMCESICAGCPLADVCEAYATAAQVESGFWAGRSYSLKRNYQRQRH